MNYKIFMAIIAQTIAAFIGTYTIYLHIYYLYRCYYPCYHVWNHNSSKSQLDEIINLIS